RRDAHSASSAAGVTFPCTGPLCNRSPTVCSSRAELRGLPLYPSIYRLNVDHDSAVGRLTVMFIQAPNAVLDFGPDGILTISGHFREFLNRNPIHCVLPIRMTARLPSRSFRRLPSRSPELSDLLETV